MKKAFAFKIVCSCVTPENIWRNRFCWLCFRPAETDVPLKTSEDYSKEESVTTATENKTTTAKTTAQTPTMATTAGGERYQFIWWPLLFMPGFKIRHFENNSRGKKLKTQGKNSITLGKKLKVLANFDYQVTKYLSNGQKNPSFVTF